MTLTAAKLEEMNAEQINLAFYELLKLVSFFGNGDVTEKEVHYLNELAKDGLKWREKCEKLDNYIKGCLV